jgi:hypothetical protein
VDEGTLRFEVGQAKKISWGSYFRDLMRPRFGGGFENYSGRGPSVIVQNACGQKLVVAVCKTLKEANEKAVVIEHELKDLGAAAWCERYDVPLAFVAGDTDPSPTTG